jgi:hypothetical protein
MTMNATTVKFTADEKKLLGSLAYDVWNECAYDLLQAVAEEKGKDINSVLIPRSHVIEIALDAGRMEEKLERCIHRGNDPVATPDLMERVKAADYKTLIAAVKPAFSYARYGM